MMWILVFVLFGLHQESSAIVNGYKAENGTFPWHVGIYMKQSTNDYRQTCGGTLIGLDLVISAAHCFYDYVQRQTHKASEYRVIAGKYYRSYIRSEPYAQESSVKQIYLSERYFGYSGNYAEDIALVRLNTSFTNNEVIEPIRIDWDNELESEWLRSGFYGKIAGWGITETGKASDELRGINLPYVPYKECATAVSADYREFITRDKFCAGYLNGSSVCNDDSGGGLCYNFDGFWYLRGIGSVIRSRTGHYLCDHTTYATFTNVTYHLDWILAVDSSVKNVTLKPTGCILPEQPANGSFQLSSCSGKCIVEPGTRVGKGSVLTYSCNEGYTVQGYVIRVCENNMWSRSSKCIVDESWRTAPGNQWIGYVVVAVFTLLTMIPIMGAWMCYLNRREKAARRRFILATIERFHSGDKDRLDPELAMADQAELLPYDKSAEFPRKLLRLGKTLGSGAFGIVMKAEAKSISRGQKVSTVAVKMVRATHRLDHMMALQRELKVLAHLGKHLNIVNLLGACTDRISYGELFVIVEFCRFGNLRDYLMRGRSDFVDQIVSTTATGMIAGPSCETGDFTGNDSGINTADIDYHSAAKNCSESTDQQNTSCSVTVADEPVLDAGPVQPVQESRYDGDFEDFDRKPIGTRDLLCWAWQVSRGMKFLASKKVVHGDLATRNILLADNNVIKICDFGLAKALYASDIYKKEGNGPLPVKWMPIESIGDRVFSIKSDVWSFGVVLWELFTLGKTPYPGIANESVYTKLVDGYRMEKPEYATEHMYNTMLRCWNAEPSERPPFEELETIFDDLLEVKVKTDYLDFDRPYAEINAEALANGKKDVLAMSPAEYVSSTAEMTV